MVIFPPKLVKERGEIKLNCHHLFMGDRLATIQSLNKNYFMFNKVELLIGVRSSPWLLKPHPV